MAQTKKDYIELERLIEGINAELAIKRCANCEHNFNRKCTIYSQEIPDEHEYTYTDCDQWRSSIPF